MPSIKKDLVGKRFGRLIVLDKYEKRKMSNRNRVYWQCRCDCGNLCFIQRSSLLASTKSCGCIKSEKLKIEYGLASKKELLRKYKRAARSRKLKWKLTFAQFIILTSSRCFYCNSAPYQRQKSLWNNGDYIYNGIDRLDNSEGYVKSNSVTCCGKCNHAKHTMSKKEFLDMVTKIYRHHFVKGE